MANYLDRIGAILRVPPELAYKAPFPMWQRVEPRCRANNFSRSLQAPVHDALWMLTRQWQFGEFQGDDAATPVRATIQTRVTKLTHIRMGDGDPGTSQLNLHERPLETTVEREVPDRRDWRRTVQIGQQFERELGQQNELTDDQKKAVTAALRRRFPITLPGEDQKPDYDEGTWRFLQAVAGREIDGEALINSGLATENPSLPPDLSIPAESVNSVRNALMGLWEWYRALYGVRPGQMSPAWQKARLEYEFQVAAPDPNQSDGEIVLIAPEYDGKILDWPDFSIRDNATQQLIASEPGASSNSVIGGETAEFIPTPVFFRGMPNHRWWEFEDRLIDFGDLDINTVDLGKLLLMEFALIHGNDWFLFPLPIGAGSLCYVPSLVVTDVFGQSTAIRRAGDSESWQHWDLFHLSTEASASGNSQARPAKNEFLFLPPTLPRSDQSAPLEEVNFFRDEMANMVWAVERTILGGTGEPLSGYEEYLGKLRRRAELRAGQPEYEPDTAGEEVPSRPAISYRLSNTVPENWIPFIPEHTGNASRQVELRQANMVRNEDNLNPAPVQPSGYLLTQAGQAHRIHEETIRRSATRLRLVTQRARWIDGSTHLWIGRTVGPGGGEGSSGLRFDIVKDNVQE